jgi:Thioesterase-like superfamily
MRRISAKPNLRLARLTVEFLRSIPMSELHIEAHEIRPGHSVRLLGAELQSGGRAVALARAWEIAFDSPQTQQPVSEQHACLVPQPQPQRFFPGLARWGYGEAIEWRWVNGAYDQLGAASVWARVRIPLISGEPPHPVDAALILADSANGISSVLPFETHLFIPTAVTITLHRHPEQDWINLSARTMLSGDGLGSTLATLGDQKGELGSVTQPIMVITR